MYCGKVVYFALSCPVKGQDLSLRGSLAVSYFPMPTSKPLLKACLREKTEELVVFVNSGENAEFLDKELACQLRVESEPLLTALHVHLTKTLLVSVIENQQACLSIQLISSPHAPSCSLSLGC